MEKQIKTASFINENTYYKNLEERKERREEVAKKDRKKNLIITATCAALLGAGVTFGLVKAHEYNSKPINMIIREAEIHAGHYMTPDGRVVNPKLDHDCVIGDRSEGSVEHRIEKYAKEHNYNDVEAAQIGDLYKSLEQDEISNDEFEDEINRISK